MTINPVMFFFSAHANLVRNCDILSKALSRYRSLIFPKGVRVPRTSEAPELRELRILVDSPECGYPQFGDDEWYSLNLEPGPRSVLKARTIWGMLRGLETFSQLIYNRNDGVIVVNATMIEDWPAYKYRGVLIDTARHFIPKRTLLKNLDAMAMNKFNVMHWHLVRAVINITLLLIIIFLITRRRWMINHFRSK